MGFNFGLFTVLFMILVIVCLCKFTNVKTEEQENKIINKITIVSPSIWNMIGIVMIIWVMYRLCL